MVSWLMPVPVSLTRSRTWGPVRAPWWRVTYCSSALRLSVSKARVPPAGRPRLSRRWDWRRRAFQLFLLGDVLDDGAAGVGAAEVQHMGGQPYLHEAAVLGDVADRVTLARHRLGFRCGPGRLKILHS